MKIYFVNNINQRLSRLIKIFIDESSLMNVYIVEYFQNVQFCS